MAFPCFHLLAHTARSVPDWKNSLKVINMYQPNLEYCIKWSRWFRGCAKGQKKFILSRSGKLCRLLKLLSLASQHPKQLMKPKSKPQWHATCLKRSRNNTKCYRHARPLQRAMHQAGELARGGRQLQREVMWQGPDALRKLWVYMSLHQWLHCGQRWKLVHNPDANRSGSIWPGTSRLIAGSFTHKQKCLDTQKRTTYVFQAA